MRRIVEESRGQDVPVGRVRQLLEVFALRTRGVHWFVSRH